MVKQPCERCKDIKPLLAQNLCLECHDELYENQRLAIKDAYDMENQVGIYSE